MALKLITPATAQPVTLEEVKLACRFDTTDLDDDIEAMLAEATRLVEHETGVSLMPQTWELTLSEFSSVLTLTRPPVAAVTSIKYIDTAGVQQTLSPGAYALDTSSAYGPATITPVYGTTWPATRSQPGAVVVRYTSGYANIAAVPQQLKRQIKIVVATLIDNPDALSDRLAAIDKVWT